MESAFPRFLMHSNHTPSNVSLRSSTTQKAAAWRNTGWVWILQAAVRNPYTEKHRCIHHHPCSSKMQQPPTTPRNEMRVPPCGRSTVCCVHSKRADLEASPHPTRSDAYPLSGTATATSAFFFLSDQIPSGLALFRVRARLRNTLHAARLVEPAPGESTADRGTGDKPQLSDPEPRRIFTSSLVPPLLAPLLCREATPSVH
jgi:hypothetical protein